MPARKNWKEASAQERAGKIVAELAKHYEPVCALHFRNPFELLIATILSAQCTDERVNQVTQELFKKYSDAQSLGNADLGNVEAVVRPTGFFHQKAKSIIAVSQSLAKEFEGIVPKDMDTLIQLPGIGRKTANVVLGTAYGVPAIMVDTHVKRLSNRLALSENADPEKIERDLIALIPEKERTDFSHRLIWHGRKICAAKKPKCEICPIAEYCPAEKQEE